MSNPFYQNKRQLEFYLSVEGGDLRESGAADMSLS